MTGHLVGDDMRFRDETDFLDHDLRDIPFNRNERPVALSRRQPVSGLKLEFFSAPEPVNGSLLDPARSLDAIEYRANRDRPIAPARTSDAIRRSRIFAEWSRAKGFNPAGRVPWPSTLYGAAARTSSRLDSSWAQVFRQPTLTIPCIERAVRREVLFAHRRGGRGYRRPKRRTWVSNIRC